MAASTSIEWTATVHPDGTVTPGKTWNPVTGCDKVSPGCAHCFAEAIAKRLWATTYPPVACAVGDPREAVRDAARVHLIGTPGQPGLRFREFTDVQCHEDRLLEPLSWRTPARVFVNSMSDLFHEDAPDAFIDRVFAVMALAPQHTFQILTKRPERMRAYLSALTLDRIIAIANAQPNGDRAEVWIHENLTTVARRAKDRVYRHAPHLMPLHIVLPLPNVWLGVSVENQHFADERIPLLLQTPAAIRFISYEPVLGPVDLVRGGWTFLEALSPPPGNKRGHQRGLDWVIVGGESGPGARPFDLAWARSIVAQCKAAGVACFVKQLGAKPYWFDDTQRVLWLKDRKGGDPSEWPEDLRVRQFPITPITGITT